MCGIAGCWSLRTAPDVLRANVRRMTSRIAYRGPDGEGHWCDGEAGIALGHRRLSIIDLSAEGNQPMTSHSTRYVMVFNGEIYNFKDIRRELPLQSWRGHSDTEVLLAAIERWGIEGATRRLIGMFAFAVWDRSERQLYLVRDRLGIKPLYYGWNNRGLFFGSELKALNAHEDFEGELSQESIAAFLQLSYVPAPATIYTNARKIQPGTIVTFSEPGARPTRVYEFWSARDKVQAGCENPWTGGQQEAVEAINELVLDSVRLRMISDVPLGAFLSGGIDSTLVVALMQSLTTQRVRTFTVGFEDPSYDESKHAARIAEFLGTDHTAATLSAAETMAAIPTITELYDEPFADASQIPTYLVSKIARRHVTVSLSGDGGDELFGGYTRHLWIQRLERWNNYIPRIGRRALSTLLTRISPDRWDTLFAVTNKTAGRIPLAGMKIHKCAPLLTIEDPIEMFAQLISNSENVPRVLPGFRTTGKDSSTWLHQLMTGVDFQSSTQAVMFLDAVTYLPDDILCKLDRATMGVSLEGRVPLLDHRLVELAWRLPTKWKIHNGRGKWILREVLSKYVPAKLFERPKMGFAIPVGDWVRGPLRDWAESLLGDATAAQSGVLEMQGVRSVWSDHLSGRSATDQRIWTVLMLLAWLKTHGSRCSLQNVSVFA